MTRMNCKLTNQDGNICGQQIDYNPDTKTAVNLDGSAHLHKKKNFTSKKAIPIEAELELVARLSTAEAKIKEIIERLDRAEQGLRDTLEIIAKKSFEKATGETLG